MYSFPNLEPVCCSMSSSNCCFLTCIQISQEAGEVVWYFHLFKNFPQFVVIHTVKGFGIVNKAEVGVFLELLLFWPPLLCILNLSPSPMHEAEKWKWSRSVVSDSSRPHGLQPTRLLCPWDSAGKSTGVGCHFLSNVWKWKVKVKSLSRVRLFSTPWTAAYQAPLSIWFSTHEQWNGLPYLLGARSNDLSLFSSLKKASKES